MVLIFCLTGVRWAAPAAQTRDTRMLPHQLEKGRSLRQEQEVLTFSGLPTTCMMRRVIHVSQTRDELLGQGGGSHLLLLRCCVEQPERPRRSASPPPPKA